MVSLFGNKAHETTSYDRMKQSTAKINFNEALAEASREGGHEGMCIAAPPRRVHPLPEL